MNNNNVIADTDQQLNLLHMKEQMLMSYLLSVAQNSPKDLPFVGSLGEQDLMLEQKCAKTLQLRQQQQQQRQNKPSMRKMMMLITCHK